MSVTGFNIDSSTLANNGVAVDTMSPWVTCGGKQEREPDRSDDLRSSSDVISPGADSPDAMFQRGRIVLLDGGSYLGRTMLTRLYSGEVRQVIETSKVEGQNSMTGFDAICRSRT